jgi:hypothetical protein
MYIARGLSISHDDVVVIVHEESIKDEVLCTRLGLPS